jgi:ketosteroid isomerase-like protein
MSKGNADIARRTFELWNLGDLDEWGRMHHPDVIVDPPDGWPESEQPRSREQWLAQAIRLTDSWDSQHIEVNRITEAGDRVVVLFSWITRGKGSRIDLVTDMACVATMQDGLIRRLAYFSDEAEALEAAGLSK